MLQLAALDARANRITDERRLTGAVFLQLHKAYHNVGSSVSSSSVRF
jgi:hypothetical protein